MTGFDSKRQAAQAKVNDDDDTQVYADTLLIVYQRGFADGKKSAQPEQEPTQWRDMVVVNLVREGINKHKARELADHFATPPAAQRKPLTDERLKEIWYATQNIMGWYSFQEIARAVEAAHGIKEGT